ncbi:hypothetical protein Drose_22055 [Dactylosporangium roseum]|uniref:Uncharacterized protein n=1 Tax=Dactylosporangium roseum TaxID=47989 RepID=A0ABY5YZG7_9ACTN|nr:hypothetical protein [Dactylosporangium roseum]UWZ33948.1 hypothetical protein Drose_22055 [Dactylosporangium roseum]
MFPGAEEDQQLSGAAHVRGLRRFRRYLHRYRRGRHKALAYVGSRIGLASTVPAPLRTRVAVAAVITITAAALASTLSSSAAPLGSEAGVAFVGDAERSPAGGGVSRDLRRMPLPWSGHPRGVPPTKAAPAPARPPSAQVSPPAATAAPSAAPSPTVHAPVGGLSQDEMDNAVAIIEAGQQMNLPPRAYVIALATALQESHLRVLANPNVPGSMGHPNEGVGYDHDSIGLFQQRPSWGSVEQLMDPHESARRFYAALVRIPNWAQLAITVAAQTVQVSAFPDAYAKWQPLAEQIVDAVV